MELHKAAEERRKRVYESASCAVGCLMGISSAIDDLCSGHMLQMATELSHIAPELDDRIINNYALLVCLPENVGVLYCILNE